MLQTHPETIHLAHVLQDELNRVIDVTALALILITAIWQDVLHHLEQVVSKEQSACWLLHAFDHVKQVTKDQLDSCLFSFDVCSPHSDQQIKSGNDRASMLH